MDKEKQREKYGIAGAIATIMQIQMLVVGLALVLTAYGIIVSFDSPSRLIVYILQAVSQERKNVL